MHKSYTIPLYIFIYYTNFDDQCSEHSERTQIWPGFNAVSIGTRVATLRTKQHRHSRFVLWWQTKQAQTVKHDFTLYGSGNPRPDAAIIANDNTNTPTALRVHSDLAINDQAPPPLKRYPISARLWCPANRRSASGAVSLLLLHLLSYSRRRQHGLDQSEEPCER